MSSLLDGEEQECIIPHVVESARGYQLVAQCSSGTRTLRVTSGHLVYTNRGLQAAKDVREGDLLFEDLEESKRCKLIQSIPEKEVSKFFGLNCQKSVVQASGLKCSTFENLHSVPSFWMSVVSRVLGLKRASSIGDWIVRMGFLN